MSLKIVFFDLNKIFIETYKNALQSKMKNTSFIHTDLDTLIKNNSNINAIVSPANSYGWMNGGIDQFINKLLNGVEFDVKQRINKVGMIDSRGDRYLPVGKCEVVYKCNKYLFVSPTMMMPTRLYPGNKNIMLAFFAMLQKAIELVRTGKNIILACPCLGTGVGKMDPVESANQILTAWNHIIDNKMMCGII
jgi:O-acetyl-ADP-ribose deacetylase (regulator of RNase III)